MVNSGNFFGARGRAADPMSDRQLAMRCKERGLVFDRETKSCRESRRGAGLDRAREARRQKRGDGPTMAQLRAECKARGLTLDVDTKSCRESRRGAGLDRAREARREKRGGAMTIAQLRAECKARGLVLDKDTKSCRAAARRLSGLEAAYKRGSLFFGMSNGYVGGSNTLATISDGVTSAGFNPDNMLMSGAKYGLSGLSAGGMSRKAAMALNPKQVKPTAASKKTKDYEGPGMQQVKSVAAQKTDAIASNQAAVRAAFAAAYTDAFNAAISKGLSSSAASQAALRAMKADPRMNYGAVLI